MSNLEDRLQMVTKERDILLASLSALMDRVKFQAVSNGKLLARNIELEHELCRRIKRGSIR
jgi:hypothetical protein